MSWEAVGSVAELLGSLGVLITLVYLAIQIRGAQTGLRNAAVSATHEARIAINIHRSDNIDLVINANSGDELTKAELARLMIMIQNENISMMFSFQRFKSLGEDGFTQLRYFARFLCDNPALEKLWREEIENVQKDFDGIQPPLQTEWSQGVREHLSAIKALRSKEGAVGAK